MRSHSVLQIGLGVALMAGAISVATAADMPSSDNIGVFRIEFPALQHGIEDPVPRHRVRPGRGGPLPITVGSKGRDASMKSNTLVGSWINVASGGFAVQGADGSVSTGRGGSGMSYEFNANGTYSYTANFEIVISDQRITIHEKGTYSVQDDTLTLMPTSKRYMRNGVDEGDELKVRVFKFRLELNASQDQVNLILPGEASDDVFIKG